MIRTLTALLLFFACAVDATTAKGENGSHGAAIGCIAIARSQESLDRRVADLSQQIANKIEAGQKQKIAVLEFTDLQGNVTDFGRYLAEELITRLYESNKFKVIERQLLNKVIAEQKLSLSGVVDPASARKLGSVLGVDAIVSGTIADRGESLKVNARLISSETGEIFSAAATEMAKDKEVLALMNAASPERKPLIASGEPRNREVTKVVSDDFTFELSGCRRSGNSVTCEFAVINNASEDRLLQLFADNYHISTKSSRLIDANGNEYYPTGSRLGSAVGDARQLWVRLSLVPQVPTRASLRFEGIGASVVSITLLRITFNREGKPRSMRGPHVDYADFKSVPIE
jgi:TolB-like protein